MSFSLLDLKLQDNADKINEFKSEILNKDHKIINHQNKIDLYKRFQILIANNDIPRLQQLLTVCLNHGDGMNAILTKLVMAVNGSYKPKGWSEDKYLKWEKK